MTRPARMDPPFLRKERVALGLVVGYRTTHLPCTQAAVLPVQAFMPGWLQAAHKGATTSQRERVRHSQGPPGLQRELARLQSVSTLHRPQGTTIPGARPQLVPWTQTAPH